MVSVERLERHKGAMKTIKILVGVGLACGTVSCAVQLIQTLLHFIRIWMLTGDWAQGLSQSAAGVVALAMMTCFTVWTFQSAFRKKASHATGSGPYDQEKDPAD